jgi:hypothetical protein
VGNKVSVIDEVIKECVPGFGVDASGLDHVFQFFDPVISQSTDCFIGADVNSDDVAVGYVG